MALLLIWVSLPMRYVGEKRVDGWSLGHCAYAAVVVSVGFKPSHIYFSIHNPVFGGAVGV